MFRLIYISGETSPFSKNQLENLLELARDKNTHLGITGLLLYKHGNFLQVLEGEKATVLSIFETIRQDPRHRRVIPILQEPIEKRDFGEWSMAYREIDMITGPVPPGFSDLLMIPWDKLDVAFYSETVRKYLSVFMAATA